MATRIATRASGGSRRLARLTARRYSADIVGRHGLLAGSPQNRPSFVSGGVAVVVFLAYGPSLFHRLLDGDEAIYGSIAAIMNLGGRLYEDGRVDNKPPGIFWVYATTFQLAGT
jgi:hypothetical protein